MAGAKWIKFYPDMFNTSRRLKDIESLKKGDTFVVIWVKLLLLAGDVNDGGAIYITSKKPYTTKQLSDEFRKKEKDVSEALDLFEERGMIERDESGFIYIPSWEMYQDEDKLTVLREKNRIAQQRARERRKNGVLSRDASRDCHMTNGDKSRDCHAIEEEGRDRYHSYNHSLGRAPAPAREDAMTIEEKRRKELKYLRDDLGRGLVMLSDEQFEKICEELSLDEIHKYIPIVADEEEKGHHYTNKTHFQAIMEMVRKDRKAR